MNLKEKVARYRQANQLLMKNANETISVQARRIAILEREVEKLANAPKFTMTFTKD